MTDFSELTQRVARRLGRDPELQREVSSELQSHLEDSTAENIAAGMNDQDAREAAVRSLGPEAELAEQLWQANRRRIGLRKTVKWATGVVAIPAAAAVSVWVLWGTVASTVLVLALGHVVGNRMGSRPSSSVPITGCLDH
jgi:Flp pilus assembly protein TadB